MIKRETYLLMDVAIPDDSNVNIKETEKLSKYKDQQVEVSRMCKASTKIVPVIIGALGRSDWIRNFSCCQVTYWP